ncbi:MAG: helix-turn-helix domain-containing protein [Oscillospiraceae bacterium]|jgi:transcriptional regulator with XRE-family HTH domain|nr:helix-turn-helix domain-containing protein [Oscillospiraceae bacterium]
MVGLGEKLRTLRLGKNLTQKQLGERIGISKYAVSMYELDSRAPSYEVLVKLAVFFRVSADYLLDINKPRCVSVEGLKEKQISAIVTLIETMRDD